MFCVVDIKPFSDSTDTEVHVAEGDAAVFDLPLVNSYPPAIIQWVDVSGNVLRRTADNHHITLTNQLVVLSTRYDVDNNVVLRATATNGYTQQSISSPSYLLRVHSEYIVRHYCESV